MNIASANINELLKLGFNPDTCVYQGGNQYSIDKDEFVSFADRKGWEKGLDYSFEDDSLSIHIVLQAATRASAVSTPVYGECQCNSCKAARKRQAEANSVDTKISNLRNTVRNELSGIKRSCNSSKYCQTQLALIKDVILG